jgi:hypothetical protein
MAIPGFRLRGWLRRGNGELPHIEPGAVFRRVRPNNLIETARVLAVTTDDAGIPHVRVDIEIDGPAYAQISRGQRLLAVAAFAQDYPEQVGGRHKNGEDRRR